MLVLDALDAERICERSLALDDDRKFGGGGRSGPYLYSSGYGRFFLI
jgi:hypothetical protein